MKLLAHPIVTPPTSEQLFGRKLAKLIATMRRLPEPPSKTKHHGLVTNGMAAYSAWDSAPDDKF